MAMGTELALGFLTTAVLLLLSALVSGSEVAFFSLTANDYEELEQSGTASGKIILSIRERPRYLLATILIANNFINIAIVLVSSLLLRELFPQEMFSGWAARLHEWVPAMANLVSPEALADGIAFVITIVGVTFLLVLFGEVAPKVYARYYKVQLASRMAGPMQLMMGLFRPLSYLLVNGAGVIERKLERHTAGSSSASQSEIDEAIDLTVSQNENGEDGQLQDVDILKRIVQFNNVTVRQIMRSRGDVIAVDEKIDYHELLAVVREHTYSRIPVFEEDFDKVKGLLYVKDLLGYRNEPATFEWGQLVRKDILFIPENKKISDLLSDFQQEKMHMAIVVDEYGGSEGIVTLEDILEEVIGDIHDEFDGDDEIIFQRIDDLNYVFDGKTLLNDVCRLLQLPTSTFDDIKGEAESFAGLLLEMAGHLPKLETEFEYGDYRFRVMSVTKRRIQEVLITLPEPPGEEGGEE